MIEGFDLGLKMIPKNRTKVNQSWVSLGIVKALDSYLDFIDYVHMSKSWVDDIISFKKNGNFC